MSDPTLTQPPAPVPPAPPASPPDTTPPAKTDVAYDPVDEYKEYPLEEAQEGNLFIDPSNPEHQAARLEHSNDYLVGEEPGYAPPDYS